MYELIRVHQEDHKRDKFSRVISDYLYWEETMERTVKRLMHRTDYEFFLARLPSSKEIVGWIAISFVSEGNETIGRHKFEARLEWTEMCSNILQTWKVESASGKSNVWDEIKRASSSLQAKHMPPNHCIINALTLYNHEQFDDMDIASALLEHVILYWENEVDVGTEWAIWVQSPPFLASLYNGYGFEELGEYEIELSNYGFPPKSERKVSGRYGWKFMILRLPSGSAIPVAPALGKGKGKQQDLDDLQEKLKNRWELAERRLEEIWEGRGHPPLTGEVDLEMKTKRDAEAQGYRPPSYSKGKNREKREDIPRPAPREEPAESSLQGNTFVTSQSKGKNREKQEEIPSPAPRGQPPSPPLQGTNIPSQSKAKKKENQKQTPKPAPRNQPPSPPRQGTTTIPSQPHHPQDNFIPSKSEEDLIEAMREGGVDEEEIELVKALTFSLSDEIEGE